MVSKLPTIDIVYMKGGLGQELVWYYIKVDTVGYSQTMFPILYF